MLNLLNSKEKRKINILQNILSNEVGHYQHKTLYSIVTELNNDFIANELNVQLIKHSNDYLLNNPLNISEDMILQRLVNFYATSSTPFIFVDTLMDVYYDTHSLKIKDIIEYFPMTRQNVYKLIERVNEIVKKINIKLIPKNSEIIIKGELINIILQCYRYFNLHYYQLKTSANFEIFQQLLLQGYSVSQVRTENSILTDLFSFSNQINKETMFIQYLSDLGEVKEYKQTKWSEISSLSSSDINHIEELYYLSKQYLSETFQNNSSSVKFDTLLIIILSDLVPYKNFHSIFRDDKQKNRVNRLIRFFQENTNIDVEKEYGNNFGNYIDLVSQAYSEFFSSYKIVFYVESFKGKIFELILEKFVKANFSNRDLNLTNDSRKADIILSDSPSYDSRSVLITNIDSLFSCQSYRNNIIFEINQKIEGQFQKSSR